MLIQTRHATFNNSSDLQRITDVFSLQQYIFSEIEKKIQEKRLCAGLCWEFGIQMSLIYFSVRECKVQPQSCD